MLGLILNKLMGVQTDPLTEQRERLRVQVRRLAAIDLRNANARAASRLEQSCRDLSVQTLVSAATVAAAQANSEGMAITMLSVKGKLDQIGAVQFRRALDVPAAWALA